jgi:hypothetical protein
MIAIQASEVQDRARGSAGGPSALDFHIERAALSHRERDFIAIET